MHTDSTVSMEPETLYDLFAKAASIHSKELAVTFDDGSGSSESLGYKHLRALSAELSGILRQSCLTNKGVIGLYCRENLFLPVWILGIMQTPAAYAPLDPAVPGLLSARVIERCGLMYCAVQTELMEKFQQSLGEYLKLDVCVVLPKFKLTLAQVKTLQGTEQDEQTEQAAPQAFGGTADLMDSFAYVLHTSGTTGLPKIVKVPHRCIYPNICHLSQLFQIKKGDVVFLASPLTFDPSVVEIFMALTSGANLLIIPSLLKKIPKRLAQLLFTSHKTTVLQATPTLFCRFGPNILKENVLSADSSLRVLVLGGEPCPTPEQLANWKHKDNKTEIFNIYGITEVSCWALCYRITQRELQSRQTTPVPIGDTLTGTMVEVRDEYGVIIKDGEGQVFIGGEHRVCLLDDENVFVPGTMRATGDWVRIRDRHMYFLGRRDRLIKRHGHRINLDTVQQLISAAPLVESCAVGLHENHWLIAFIVASKSEDGKVARVVVCDTKTREEQDGGAGEVGRAVLKQLSRVLAYYSLPDTVVIVPEIPLTSHGKVDMEALMKIYQMHRNGLQSSSQREFSKENLQSLWKASLGLSKDAAINEDSNFLLSGGDSLKALVFHEDILNATGLTSPNLLEIILDGTFSDIVQHIWEVKNNRQVKPEAKKRHLEKPIEVLAKRERKMSDTQTFKVIKRGSQMVEMHRNKSTGCSQAMGHVALNKTSDGLQTVSLKMLWSSDTGRCVDASPVILVKQTDKSTVFIGSHSHRIQALDLDSGHLVWERVLGDRIEASAAVSPCGTLVIVGCYDSCVYFLAVSSGETEWVFKTGDAVKCCPAADAETGLVLVGSHDGEVYALDPKAQRCVWKHHCGGAVFSSPFIHPSSRHLYVATLGGRLLCLNMDGGEVLWSYSKDAPFFSSPVGSETHIMIGSADGNICCFSITGELLWQFLTQAPVFSSPSLTLDQQQVLCGSHDGRIYCLNISDGSLLWSFETSGRVYSSPCVFVCSARGMGSTLVGLASTDGTVWILDSKTGLKLASHILPGELFSSLVVYKDLLVIGCRNDYVYCLKLEQK